MSRPAYRPGWQMRLAAVPALLAGLFFCGTAVRAQQATLDEVKEFEKFMPNLKRAFNEKKDQAPAKVNLNEFKAAYNKFVAAPEPEEAAGADIVRRQGSLKTMEYLALRNGWLARCLVAIIVGQAKSYCHLYSPYFDRLQLGADVPRAATGGNDGKALDPNAPFNSAQLLKNADLAFISAFVDTLKKLEIDRCCDELFDHLEDRTTDDKASHLLLAVLSDADMRPNLERSFAFLQVPPEPRFGPARYFFIQKLLGNPFPTADQKINVLKTQLGDHSKYASDIQAVVFKTLKTLESVDDVSDYSIVKEVATIAATSDSPDLRTAGNEVLVHLLSLIGRDQAKLTAFATQIAESLMYSPSLASIRAGDDQAERKSRIAFLRTITPALPVMPAPAADPTNTFSWTTFVEALLKAFDNAKYLKKNPAGRVEIALIWSAAFSAKNMQANNADFNAAAATYGNLQLALITLFAATPADSVEIAIVGSSAFLARKKLANVVDFNAAAATVHDKLQFALFAATPEEQAAFLTALGAMTRKPEE